MDTHTDSNKNPCDPNFQSIDSFNCAALCLGSGNEATVLVRYAFEVTACQLWALKLNDSNNLLSGKHTSNRIKTSIPISLVAVRVRPTQHFYNIG